MAPTRRPEPGDLTPVEPADAGIDSIVDFGQLVAPDRDDSPRPQHPLHLAHERLHIEPVRRLGDGDEID